MARATKLEVGQWGEAIAMKHLQERGYVILARNWRHGHGELDIVARQGETVVFVEVRTRRSHAFGAPEETITSRKQAKLIVTAEAYLEAHQLADVQWQIDAIVIELDGRNNLTRLDHIEFAIER